jgi:hypothetical protein
MVEKVDRFTVGARFTFGSFTKVMQTCVIQRTVSIFGIYFSGPHGPSNPVSTTKTLTHSIMSSKYSQDNSDSSSTTSVYYLESQSGDNVESMDFTNASLKRPLSEIPNNDNPQNRTNPSPLPFLLLPSIKKNLPITNSYTNLPTIGFKRMRPSTLQLPPESHGKIGKSYYISL